MTFQHLTVSMFENSKANNGFIDRKEFNTNLSYTFDSLVLDALPTRVIALYVEHGRPLLNPQNDYLLLTRNGTQYKKQQDTDKSLERKAQKSCHLKINKILV